MASHRHTPASASSASPPHRPLWWLVVSLLVVGLDQFTKWLVVTRFDLYERMPVLPFFDLVRVHNSGAAFSLLADAGGWQNGLFAVIALAVSVFIVWWLRQQPAGRVAVPLGLSLVLGGAAGNLVDRLLHGYVIDFFLLYYQRWSYPAFNVADAAITCGVVLLLWDGVVLERRRLHQR